MAMNIAIITIDSLRLDTARQSEAPNFEALLSSYQDIQHKGWVKVGAQGTYTLPSHISMFHSGILPTANTDDVPAPYNRKKRNLFKAQLKWTRPQNAVYPTPEAPNIVRGFDALGYRTVGIGGVHWFNTKFQTSGLLWQQYFREFFWSPEFAEENFSGFENQIQLTKSLQLAHDSRPLFYFLNISGTHYPYLGNEVSVQGQMRAFEYIDRHICTLIELLPRPVHILLMSDHGECFGEDGLWEHGFYHPMVMEIPMASLVIS